jgi:hypothetical protein
LHKSNAPMPRTATARAPAWPKSARKSIRSARKVCCNENPADSISPPIASPSRVRFFRNSSHEQRRSLLTSLEPGVASNSLRVSLVSAKMQKKNRNQRHQAGKKYGSMWSHSQRPSTHLSKFLIGTIEFSENHLTPRKRATKQNSNGHKIAFFGFLNLASEPLR